MATSDCCFSAAGKTFAHLSGNSRLHLWDVSRRQSKSYVDKHHLSHSSTCYAWSHTGGLFVVGFSDGLIVVWDVSRGVVSRTIGKAGESVVPTDVGFSADCRSIYVSSDQPCVVQYDVASGAVLQSIKCKKGLLKLAVNPKAEVLAACSSSVRLLDVGSGRSRKLDAALSGGVSAVAFTPCGRFLAAASTRTREVLVFDVRDRSDGAEEEEEGAGAAPVYVLPVRGVVSALEGRSGKGVFELLIIFEDSGACLLELDAHHGKNRASGVNSVRTATDISSHCPLLAGCFGGASEVVFAVGSKASPAFLPVDTSAAVEGDGTGAGGVAAGVHKQLTVGRVEAADPSEGRVGRGGEGVITLAELLPPEMLGPHEMGGVKRPALGEAEGAGRRKSWEMGASWAGADERSLEVRLAALSQSLSQLEKAEALPAPTSDSLVALVEQALQSGDDSLLEQCLACTDPAVVESTSQCLPVQLVVPLLRRVVAKFERRPSRGAMLTAWVGCLLRAHTAFLVTVPDLSQQLAGLGQMLEQRLGTYCKLSSLAGRLDLLMAQVDYREASGGGVALES